MIYRVCQLIVIRVFWWKCQLGLKARPALKPNLLVKNCSSGVVMSSSFSFGWTAIVVSLSLVSVEAGGAPLLPGGGCASYSEKIWRLHAFAPLVSMLMYLRISTCLGVVFVPLNSPFQFFFFHLSFSLLLPAGFSSSAPRHEPLLPRGQDVVKVPICRCSLCLSSGVVVSRCAWRGRKTNMWLSCCRAGVAARVFGV